jgi:serine/threonine protein phosphatase PrpC
MLESCTVTQLTIGSLADPGIGRDYQEDSLGYFSAFEVRDFWPWAQSKGNLYVVADGVGGREAGEVASQLAVNTVIDEFYRDRALDPNLSLLRAIQTANARIVQRSVRQGKPGQMRTTIVCAVIRGQELLVVNAGDSRAYLVRNGKAEQLTKDHTLIAQWVLNGQLTPEEAVGHPQNHVVTQSLGDPEGVDPSSRWEEVRTGDIIVLCSDGLYGVVDDREIASVVSRSDSPQEACEILVDMANDQSGPDNISVIVIRVDAVVPQAGLVRLPRISLPPSFGVRSAGTNFLYNEATV